MSDNILKKIADGVVDYAPSIAKILTASGVGAPAGAALDVIASLGKAFGLGNSPTPEALATAMLSDPEARLKCMIAEQDFVLKQRDQDIEILKVHLANTTDARKLESDITKATGKQDKSGNAFDWTIICGFFLTLIVYMFAKIPADQAGNLGLLIGALISAFVTVVNYRRGSSLGSARKTELLAHSPAVKE